ncbi:PAS domain-containing protein [Marivirga sp. S37H4]|uniref:histidine kinase n=1 Tax=Marivirga aurantiaca TaxID=2802615 RepID=A0A934WZP7_9BACT|nr:ATP-binding protein [Marivirga aurantiaca]MBK6265866.1 PAS domain-containing protein [Marivirga aurantiaca]
MLKFSIKDIVLGKNVHIPAESDYRKSLLVGVSCIILVFVSTVNGLLNIIFWDISLTSSFMVGILGGTLGFTLNRFRKFELAKHTLLLIALFFVFIFMSNEGKYYGSQLYLFTILVASISLFGYKRVKVWLFYAVLAFLCFAISEFTNYKLIVVDAINEAKEDKIYFLNYFFTFVSLIIIIYFQVKLQYKSEQKLIKKDLQLKESEERFRLAVEGTNAGIWDWENINKDQQWWSPKLYELLGYKPEEIEPNKMAFKNLLAQKEDFPRLVNDFKKHFRNKEPFSVEYRFKCKDGTYKWFHGSGQAKWTDDMQPIRMVGSLVDITEKKIKEEEIQEKNSLLEKSNAELDRFVYSVSHDLRAPLNSIQGLINISDTTDDTKELKQLMSMMKNRVKKLYSFIDEIINFARNSRTEIVKEPIDLISLTTEVFENAQYREQAAAIDFRLLVSENLIVHTDQGRLSIVLNNLIDNAIKYHRHSQPGKFVAIKSIEETNSVIIQVIDNGQGIPLQAQDKIFDMFYRASDNSKGSGLGLYIVKEMIERIGGEIYLKSEPGEGTTFSIKLPKE